MINIQKHDLYGGILIEFIDCLCDRFVCYAFECIQPILLNVLVIFNSVSF